MEKEIIKQTKTEYKHLKNEEEFKKSLRAYTITIKDNTSGKTLVNEETNLILGCFNKIDENEKSGSRGIAVLGAVHCNDITELEAIASLESLVKDTKKRLVQNALGKLLKELTKEGNKNE